MKPFDYNKYLMNNPLLKESINEATIKDLFGPLAAKLESMGYDIDLDPTAGYKTLFAWKVMPDKSSLTVFVGPSDVELAKRDFKGFDNFETIDVSFNYYTTKVTKKLFGLYKSKERVGQHLSDETEEGKNIDLGRGMFDIPIEDSVNRVATLAKKAEQTATGGYYEKMREAKEPKDVLKSTEPGDKLSLVLDDDSTVTVIRVGTDKSGQPTFKHIKNNKEVGTASALSISHIKSAKSAE